jgi:hypothetical protein
MAKDSSSEFSSVFDDLLDRSRREWEALSSRTPAASAGARLEPSFAPASTRAIPERPAVIASSSATPRAGAAEVLRRSGEYDSAVKVWNPAKSEAAGYLFNRFGSSWQMEVAERRRDGDEFVVLIKLAIPEKNLVKSQFGRGRIPSASGEGGLRGSAGGLAFSLGGETPAPTQPPEDRGYRRAIEDGLAKCVELL